MRLDPMGPLVSNSTDSLTETFTPIPENIYQITTPLLIGNVANWYLYGVVSVQVYIYTNSFPDDRRIIKLLIYGIFFLETVQTFLSGADIYFWFGSGFGRVPHLGNPYVSAYDTPILGSFIALIVQVFFCYRIWRFERSAWWLALIIAGISVVQCVGGFIAGIRVAMSKYLGVTKTTLVPLYLWLIGDAVADFLIAAAMIFLLLRLRNPEHKYSSTVLARTVRLIVETNSLTAGFALLAVALHAARPDSNYFIAPTLAIGKIYSNTLLATFNNRLFLNRDTGVGLFGTQSRGSRSRVRAHSADLDHQTYSAGKVRAGSELEAVEELQLDVRNTIKLHSTTTRDL